MTKADKIRQLIDSGETNPKKIAKVANATVGQVYPILKRYREQQERNKTEDFKDTLENQVHIVDMEFWAPRAERHFKAAYEHLKRSKYAKCFWGPKGSLIIDDPKMGCKTLYKGNGTTIELN